MKVYKVYIPQNRASIKSIFSPSVSPRGSPRDRSRSPLGSRAKTLKENDKGKAFYKQKFNRSKTNWKSESNKEGFNLLASRIKKNHNILENMKFLRKSSSHCYSGEVSSPSSNRERRESENDHPEEEQDFNERELELLCYNKLLTIKKGCKNLKEFEKQKHEFFSKETYLIYGIMILFYVFQMVADFLFQTKDFSENNSAIGFINFFVYLCLFSFAFFGLNKLFTNFFLRLFLFILHFTLIILKIVEMKFENDRLMMDIDFAFLFCPVVFLPNFSFFSFVEIMFINISFLIVLIGAIIFFSISDFEKIFASIFIVILIVIRNYFPSRSQIKYFNSRKNSQLKQYQQSEKILKLLPIHVNFFPKIF